MFKKALAFTFSIAAFLTIFVVQVRAQSLNLVWSDEFNGPANSAPDPSKWGFDIGGNGWGNNELEYYTNRLNNSYQDGNGNLVIKVLQEKYTGSDGVTRNYTSARLLTQNLFTQRFGRIEARIKIPFGQGIWPAFWMLGDNIDSVNWPTCGEMDIMENIGREPAINHGSLHGPGYSGGSSLTAAYTLPSGATLSDDFHIFAIDWSPNTVTFSVDNVAYETRTPADVPAGGTWVFDHPFFILLNVAVGGDYPGSPDSTTTFPQVMLVDYVRVYEDPALVNSPLLITSAFITGKNLTVNGEKFVRGAVITMNGADQPTKYVSGNGLVGKKVGKKIKSGQKVDIQVRNPDGSLSNDVTVSRQ
ncbi:MAG TPA: glycoside hydrolase family 16 protein [Blastocatellia bacterium]|nr:glycoside hydrolase family 16 protein [Blastocatellia bacterium]